MSLSSTQRLAASGLCLVLFGALPSPLDAQHVGPEFQVNSYTTGYQFLPSVAIDATGKFVVVWMSLGQDGSGSGIFGQRFDSAGGPLSIEFQVNSYTTGLQQAPAIAASGSGEFLVVWEGAGAGDLQSGVFGQRFDTGGNPAGSALHLNSHTSGDQERPAVAADGLGNFIVVWSSSDQDGSGTGVFGQRFGPTGAPLGGEFQVNDYTTGDQATPTVAADSAGSFLVAWSSEGLDLSHAAVFGRKYNVSGAPEGIEFRIDSDSTGFLDDSPAAAANGAGDFVVVWPRRSQSGEGDVFGRRVDSSGAPAGEEFQVNIMTLGIQRDSRVAMDAAGNFVVVWSDFSGQDGDRGGVSSRRFDASGVGSEIQVNTYTTGQQIQPAIAPDASGTFVVVWTSNVQDAGLTGVFGQRWSAPLFADGFVSGVVCGWSTAVGSGDSCP